MRQRRVQGATIAILVAGLWSSPTAGQFGLGPADSLLASGRLAAAEAAYYAATREHPRDPRARAALGQYLAARGAARVGAVLLEEAQFFGGDSAVLARSLVPIYVRIGDYAALDSLQPNVLSAPERRRVRWLSARRPEATLHDSVAVLAYRALRDGRGIGTVLLHIGKTELPAIIDPRVSGLVLSASSRQDVRTFGADGSSILAVTDVARIGGVAFRNVPTSIGDPDNRVRIGFDVLAPFNPAFDPRNGVVTLRRVNRRSQTPAGVHVPALFDANGLRLLFGNGWQPSSAAMPAMLLATRRWIWDSRLGDVVLLSEK